MRLYRFPELDGFRVESERGTNLDGSELRGSRGQKSHARDTRTHLEKGQFSPPPLNPSRRDYQTPSGRESIPHLGDTLETPKLY